jgi:hypothetical protein
MTTITNFITFASGSTQLCNGTVFNNAVPITTLVSVACPLPALSSSSVSASTTSIQDPSAKQAISASLTTSAYNADTRANGNPTFTSQISTPANLPGAVSSSAAPKDQSQSNKSKGLAGGAVAGIAIGMLLAGAVLAGIVFFILLRRQKRRQVTSSANYSRQHAAYTEHNVRPEKGATMVAATTGSIDSLLPQPVEDDAITGDLSKIRDNIKNHVRTYYHSGPISAVGVNETVIRDVAAMTGSSATALVNLLSDPSKRDSALRSIVAAVILTKCTGERSPSLLPIEVAALTTSVAANNNSECKFLLLKNRSPTDLSAIDHAILFSRWKTITGALLQQQHGRKGHGSSQAHDFQDTIAVLDLILVPFVKGNDDNGQRRKNLEMILKRAANFAFLLFTQPGSFRFDFASRLGELVVFPALVQTVGDQGQLLSPAKPLTEREIVAA